MRQDDREREAAEVGVIQHLLSERDEGLHALHAEAKAAPDIVKKVKGRLASDRRARTATAKDVIPRLMLTASSRSLLHPLLRHRLSDLRRDAHGQVESLA